MSSKAIVDLFLHKDRSSTIPFSPACVALLTTPRQGRFPPSGRRFRLPSGRQASITGGKKRMGYATRQSSVYDTAVVHNTLSEPKKMFLPPCDKAVRRCVPARLGLEGGLVDSVKEVSVGVRPYGWHSCIQCRYVTCLRRNGRSSRTKTEMIRVRAEPGLKNKARHHEQE